MINQNILLTTDCVIIYAGPAESKILLIKRKASPYLGKWALPGGFLEDEEDLKAGARRELEEETGLVVEDLEQIAAFGAPGRDPRGRTVTIAFLGKVDSEAEVKAADDAADAGWFPTNNLPELAFDHQKIVNEAFKLIVKDLSS